MPAGLCWHGSSQGMQCRVSATVDETRRRHLPPSCGEGLGGARRRAGAGGARLRIKLGFAGKAL